MVPFALYFAGMTNRWTDMWRKLSEGFCLGLFLVSTLWGQAPIEIPGFAEANDSIRLRLVIDRLVKEDNALSLEDRPAAIRRTIDFCEEQNFIKGQAAGLSILHSHFSFQSQLDSAAKIKLILLDGWVPQLSCRNQLNFWTLSAANLQESADYKEALKELHRALNLADSCHYPKIDIFNGLAGVFKGIGLTDSAIVYLKNALQEAQASDPPADRLIAILCNNLSLNFDEVSEPDSAFMYARLAVKRYDYPAFRLRLSNLARKANDLSLAKSELTQAASMIEANPDLNPFKPSLFLAEGLLALVQKRWSYAEEKAKEVIALAEEAKLPFYLQGGYTLLIKAQLKEQAFMVDSLGNYMDVLRDEKVNEATLKLQTQYQSLEQKQHILELDQELKVREIDKLRTRSYLLYGGLTLILMAALIFWLVKRRQNGIKRELERLRKQAVQLQMNPHFFFNSLNSINLFIARSEKQQAQEYLVKFSRLMRLTLENSQEACIPLQKEVEFLENYLSLEQLRLKNFDFEIETEPGLEKAQIPGLLIQPLVENSLIHGFRNISYRGILKITFRVESGNIQVLITDNGQGINSVPEQGDGGQKHSSFALKILKKRLLAYLPQQAGPVFAPGIASGDNPGTQVSFQFPIIE